MGPTEPFLVGVSRAGSVGERSTPWSKRPPDGVGPKVTVGLGFWGFDSRVGGRTGGVP